MRVVQELLGHASVTTTQVYTLVTADTLREIYAAAHPGPWAKRPGRSSAMHSQRPSSETAGDPELPRRN